MNEREKWKNVLTAGEEIRWTGSPKNVSLFDTSSKGKNLLLWLIAAAWLAAAFFWMLPKLIETDHDMVHLVIVMFLICCLPILMITMPFSDVKQLGRQCAYAITNRRVLIQVKDRLMTLPLDVTTPIGIRTKDSHVGNILLGSAVGRSASSDRSVACGGIKQKGRMTGLVLYHVEEPQQVKAIIDTAKRR